MEKKKPLTAEALRAKIAAIEAERKAIFEEIEPKQKRLVRLYKAREKLMEQYAGTLTDFSTDQGLQKLVDTAYDGGNGTRTGHNLLNDFAKEFAPEVYAVEFSEYGKRIYGDPEIILTKNQDVTLIAPAL